MGSLEPGCMLALSDICGASSDNSLEWPVIRTSYLDVAYCSFEGPIDSVYMVGVLAVVPEYVGCCSVGA